MSAALTPCCCLRSPGEDLGTTLRQVRASSHSSSSYLSSNPVLQCHTASTAFGKRVKRITQPVRSWCSCVKEPIDTPLNAWPPLSLSDFSGNNTLLILHSSQQTYRWPFPGNRGTSETSTSDCQNEKNIWMVLEGWGARFQFFWCF